MQVLIVEPEDFFSTGYRGGSAEEIQPIMVLCRIQETWPELIDPWAGRKVSKGPVRWLWLTEGSNPSWDHPMMKRCDLAYLPESSMHDAPGGPWLKQPDLSFEQFTEDLKKTLTALSGAAILAAHQLLRWQPHLCPKRHQALERAVFAMHFCHPDRQEGLRAFLEKRKPEFQA